MDPIEQLKNQVLLLASPADVQIGSYPKGVCIGDELAIGFEEALRVAKQDLSPDELQSIGALAEYIASFSGSEFENLWLDQDQLRKDARWATIRSLAGEILVAMGWEYETPKKDGSTYVFEDRVVDSI